MKRVPHITLKSIANNAEIDVIWEKFQGALEPLRAELQRLAQPHLEGVGDSPEPGDPWSAPAAAAWSKFQEVGTSEAKSAVLRALRPRVGPRLPAG